MKKRPTEEAVEICIRGPEQKREAVLDAVRRLGFREVNDAVPWRSVLEDPSPGQALRGARVKEGLTRRALSDRTGIPQRNLSEMENGKRVIGKKNGPNSGGCLEDRSTVVFVMPACGCPRG